MSATSEVERCRTQLDEWLGATYAGREDQRYHGELDAGYDGWQPIEVVVGRVFDQGELGELPRAAIDSILFFISRGEENGRLIAWLSTAIGSPLSFVGKLSDADFRFLCAESLARDEDFSDYQLAACFRKLERPHAGDFEILLRFFARNDSYTRRLALQSLSHLKHPRAAELAVELYHRDDCEFSRLTALETLKNTAGAEELLADYLARFEAAYDVVGTEHLALHVARLKA